MALPVEGVSHNKLLVVIPLLILSFLIVADEIYKEEFVIGEDIIPEDFSLIDDNRISSLFKWRNSLSSAGVYNWLQFSLQRKDLSFHFLTEMDRGEGLFDFTSFNFTQRIKDKVFLFGDFFPNKPRIYFSRPYARFYPTERKKEILEPLRLAAETHYLRGASLSLRRGSARQEIIGSFFFSAKGISALFDSNGIVKKIYYSGRHNDSLSRSAKGKLRETSFGLFLAGRKETSAAGDSSSICLSAIFSKYNASFAFGRDLLSFALSWEKEFLGQFLALEFGKTFPGGWGGLFQVFSPWGPICYQVSLTYQKEDFFNLYGHSPNFSPKLDNTTLATKITFKFFSGDISLSYNTKTNFLYDSLPKRLRLEFKTNEKGLNISLYGKIYPGEEKSGGGLEVGYELSPKLNFSFGVEDKYRKEKRGFKLAGRVGIFYLGNQFTFQAYKTESQEGIDFYHLEPETYKENNYIPWSMERMIFGYSGKFGKLKISLKLGLTRQEGNAYDFKGGISYD